MQNKILDLQKFETRSKVGHKKSLVSIACGNGSTVSLFACPGHPAK
ncbi:class III lanthipeptide [Secundilactobacillus paracollinoides]